MEGVMAKKILLERDIRKWYAISCPVAGVRFDERTLQLLDADGDGHIRTPEVISAIDFMESRSVSYGQLFTRDEADEKKLADVLSLQADLAKLEPSELDRAAMEQWIEKGKTPEVAAAGDNTADAEAALSKVEDVIDRYFTVPEDMPLVTEEPDCTLPLKTHINPAYFEDVCEFADKCVKPLLGERDELTRLEWKRVKAAFAPYRAWIKAKPVMNAEAKAKLDAEEKFYRFKLHLGPFIDNYITMKNLYRGGHEAMFQCGRLRIDGRELDLCFHVENEAAHSALTVKSNCCVLYLKLSRPAEKKTRNICAAVTAGTVASLYVGRNGVFYDRDGLDWEAVITKIVENQVSLREAFWLPWKKLGEGVSGTVKKFLGDKQSKASAGVATGVKSAEQSGAVLASSMAAVGIAVGMVGAAAASVVAVLSGLHPWWKIIVAVVSVVLGVSVPSMLLTYLKLRRRDIGAILNASGWAINRRMRFSMRLARMFTRCA